MENLLHLPKKQILCYNRLSKKGDNTHEHDVSCIHSLNNSFSWLPVLEDGKERASGTCRLVAGSASHCCRHAVDAYDNSSFHGLLKSPVGRSEHVILRKKVKNVYEYILIGAAVGMGFSFFEEFAYGGGEDATIVSTVGRLISVPAHMTFNMVMAEFLGRAKFSKLSGKGSVILNYVLALLVPIIIHTLYDVCTAFNSSLMRGEVSGLVRALIGYAALLVYELVVLVRYKKKTETFCGMSTLAEEAV